MTEGASGSEPGAWSWASNHGRQIVSGWLVAGGLWGLASSAWTESSLEIGSSVQASLRVPIFAILLFGVCVMSGAFLWLGLVAGEFLAPLLLSAQLIQFRLGDVEYLFSLGAGFFVGVDASDLVFMGRLGSRFIATSAGAPQEFALLLNLLPAVLLVLLLRAPRGGRLP